MKLLFSNMEKINGLISAPFTPMRVDGSLNLEKVRDYAEFLILNKMKGAFICGTTGEFPTLTPDERMQLVEKWIVSAPPDFRIIVNVSTESTRQSIELAQHALRAGAWAIGSLSPFFFKPRSNEELIDFFQDIASSVAGMPFYYYHIPGFTGVNHPVDEFLTLAEQRIPTLAGVKYTHVSLYEEALCIRLLGGKYDILHGQDETFLLGLMNGSTGGVGGTYNFAAPLYTGILDAYKRKDFAEAERLQIHSQEMIKILIKFGGNVTAGKTIMKLIGFDCGPNRLPNRTLSPDLEEALRIELDGIGFFDWSSKHITV